MRRANHPLTRRRVRTSTSCLLAAYLCVIACGPTRGPDDGHEAERYADAMCGALDDCGCQPRYGDAAACRETLTDAFARSHAAGLVIDHDCLDTVLSSETFQDCSETTHWPFVEWNCAVLHGRKGEGASCDAAGRDAVSPFRVDECAPELRCTQGRCVSPENFLPTPAKVQGDACVASDPGSCILSGLTCSAQGRCEIAPAVGEACNSNDACLSGAYGAGGPNVYCRGLGSAEVGICAVTLAEGSPCDPADSFACDGEPMYFGWCDPSTATCRKRAPAVCLADENVAGLRLGAGDMP